MEKFKKGDRIVQISTGDKGSIKERESFGNWWVDWDDGHCLHIAEKYIQLEDPAPFTTTDQALSFLIAQGFKVTIERA